MPQRPLCPRGLQLCGSDTGWEAALRHRLSDASELGHLDRDFQVGRRSPRLTLRVASGDPRLAISSRPQGGAHLIHSWPGTPDAPTN